LTFHYAQVRTGSDVKGREKAEKKQGKNTVKKLEIEKFGLRTIADAVRGSDVKLVRSSLSFALGAVLDIAGKVQKVVKRDEQCKLVIESGEVPGFVVFADCLSDAKTIIRRKVRKGSAVRVIGEMQSFGASAVCLSNCRLLL